jgi:general secretion pathway protein E
MMRRILGKGDKESPIRELHPVSAPPMSQRRASRKPLDDKEGVLTAPGGCLNHINPRLAEKCALVREEGVLHFYVLAGCESASEIESFVISAALELGERVPTPRVVDQRELRAINIGQAEAQMAGKKGTESRARLNALIARGAASLVNDVKLDKTAQRTSVRFQKNSHLSHAVERFDMSAEDGELLITSAFNFADAGDSVEQPTADQKFTITNPEKLPANVQTIRCQTAALEGGGRRLDMRFIYKSTEFSARDLSQIGLLPQHLDNLYYVQSVGAGLFTIAAPTDNGKSTTLNLFSIDMVRARDSRIDVIGIDDPVEFMAAEICQLAMSERADCVDPFEQKLLTTLRLAPHAIKIGECRTGPTANAAIDAAYTGKLVMTTQHTAGAFGIPFRYERMGVKRHVAFDPDTHVCWMSQRLVPSLCSRCRISVSALPADFDRRRRAVVGAFRGILDRFDGCCFFVRGAGCQQCQRDRIGGMPGLLQRVLVAEVILPDRDICRLLESQRDHEARHYCIVAMRNPTMALHGFQLLRGGVIGLEEFMAIASPFQLLDDLKGEEEHCRLHPGKPLTRDAAE